MHTVRAPVAFRARLLEPLLLQGLQLVQAEEDVFCLARNRCGAVELAAGILQLERFKQMTALVALVTSRIFVVAQWAGTLDESVCQEALMCLAVRLCCGLLL